MDMCKVFEKRQIFQEDFKELGEGSMMDGTIYS